MQVGRRRRGHSFDEALTAVGVEHAAPPLARLGAALRVAELGPRPDFRDSLRLQLLQAAAAGVPGPAAASTSLALATRRRSTRRLIVKVTVPLAAAAATVTGLGLASATALPGDPLYSVKRATEGLQLDLTSDDQGAGLLRLQFATTRLTEVRGLLDRHDPGERPRIAETLAAMDGDTDQGATLLTRVFLHQQTPQALAKLATFTHAQESALTSVLPALPSAAAQQSLFVLHTVAAQTDALLATTPVPIDRLEDPSTGTSTPSPAAAPDAPPVTASPTDAPSPVSPDGSATPDPSDVPQPSTQPTPASSPTASSVPSASARPTDAPPASATPGESPVGSATPAATPSGGSGGSSTGNTTGAAPAAQATASPEA